MAIETKFTANTGFVTISTANSNLDGSGTVGTVLTAASNGTLLKSVIIKAQTSTRQGMVRLFIKNASDGRVNPLLEVPIPIVTKSSRDCSFQSVIPLSYSMLASDVLLASTQYSDTFNIIAEGLDWDYPSTPTEDFTEYFANSGGQKVTTANSNLDGTGTTVLIFTTGADDTYNGCEVTSIIIKAQGSVTPGMIRFFIALSDGSSKTLFAEAVVPYVTQDGVNPSFTHQVIAQGSLAIQAGYKIYASTEVGETFSIIIEGFDWKYPA